MLTARDLEILAMIFHYDGLVVDLVRRRFWPSPGARSACYDRLARLIADGYLQATRLPSLTGVGSGRTFLTIGGRGRRELAAMLIIFFGVYLVKRAQAKPTPPTTPD